MNDRDELHVSGNPRRAPAHPGITEAMIAELVHGFYAQVRRDAVLGPIFEDRIGADWDKHLARMCDFWSSVLLGTGRYRGRPVPAHARLPGLTPEHFTRWLTLFEETARSVCEDEIAEIFIDRAHVIARGLQLSLFFADRIAGPDAFKGGVLQ